MRSTVSTILAMHEIVQILILEPEKGNNKRIQRYETIAVSRSFSDGYSTPGSCSCFGSIL